MRDFILYRTGLLKKITQHLQSHELYKKTARPRLLQTLLSVIERGTFPKISGIC